MIRKYLKSGVMENGMYEATELGTPQGGNLSPLLSNVMLNELDKELVNRGLRYVRYADDCVIAVGSSASANRVMHTITKWIEHKLGLKVNATKTHVCRPNKLKYLGFGFYKSPQTEQWTARPHETSVEKFQRKLKKVVQAFEEHIHDRPYRHAQLRDTRMDKLFCYRSHERQDGKDRRTSAHDVA